MTVVGHSTKRVQARTLSYENQFLNSQVHSNANQTIFHMKRFALGLVSKKTPKATRKWLIGESFTMKQEMHSARITCREMTVSFKHVDTSQVMG